MTLEDVCLWSDGTWCFFENLFEMSHMSDDYRMVEAGTSEWFELTDGSVDVVESSFGAIEYEGKSASNGCEGCAAPSGREA